MGKRKRSRRHDLKAWEAQVLAHIDRTDDADLPEGLTREEVRQAVSEIVAAARPNGEGGWEVLIQDD